MQNMGMTCAACPDGSSAQVPFVKEAEMDQGNKFGWNSGVGIWVSKEASVCTCKAEKTTVKALL